MRLIHPSDEFSIVMWLLLSLPDPVLIGNLTSYYVPWKIYDNIGVHFLWCTTRVWLWWLVIQLRMPLSLSYLGCWSIWVILVLHRPQLIRVGLTMVSDGWHTLRDIVVANPLYPNLIDLAITWVGIAATTKENKDLSKASSDNFFTSCYGVLWMLPLSTASISSITSTLGFEIHIPWPNSLWR